MPRNDRIWKDLLRLSTPSSVSITIKCYVFITFYDIKETQLFFHTVPFMNFMTFVIGMKLVFNSMSKIKHGDHNLEAVKTDSATMIDIK